MDVWREEDASWPPGLYVSCGSVVRHVYESFFRQRRKNGYMYHRVMIRIYIEDCHYMSVFRFYTTTGTYLWADDIHGRSCLYYRGLSAANKVTIRSGYAVRLPDDV